MCPSNGERVVDLLVLSRSWVNSARSMMELNFRGDFQNGMFWVERGFVVAVEVRLLGS